MVTISVSSLNSIDSLLDYSVEKTIDYESDVATIYIADDNEVDNINPNDDLTIEQDGSTVFTGKIRNMNVTTEPKEVVAYGKLEILKEYETNGRVFYQELTSDVISKLVTEKAVDNGKVYTSVGTITSNVSGTFTGSNTFEFEQTGFENLEEAKFGDDTIFAGIPSKSRGEIKIDFDNIDYLGDDFKTIFLNTYWNTKGEFSVEVEYYEDGQNYLWNDLNPNLDGYTQLELDKEQAEPVGELSTESKLQIRVKTNGKTQEGRAIAIDSLGFQSIDIVPRNTNITVGNVDVADDKKIIRKFSENLFDALRKINDKIPNKIIHDTQNLRTVKLGESDTVIDNAKIIGIDKEFDASNIINKVIVNGRGVKEKEVNQSSIDFYGFSNVKRIQDKSINRRLDAKNTAQNILNDKAFTSTDVIVDTPFKDKYKNITVGDELVLNGFSLDGVGKFIVVSATITEDGLLEIKARNEL